jgi:hypothetical protein
MRDRPDPTDADFLNAPVPRPSCRKLVRAEALARPSTGACWKRPRTPRAAAGAGAVPVDQRRAISTNSTPCAWRACASWRGGQHDPGGRRPHPGRAAGADQRDARAPDGDTSKPMWSRLKKEGGQGIAVLSRSKLTQGRPTAIPGGAISLTRCSRCSRRWPSIRRIRFRSSPTTGFWRWRCSCGARDDGGSCRRFCRSRSRSTGSCACPRQGRAQPLPAAGGPAA